MAHQWVNKGGFIYRLRDNGRFRNGVAEVENEYHMHIYGAKGLTESDVTALAEKIVNLLNNADTDKDQAAKDWHSSLGDDHPLVNKC